MEKDYKKFLINKKEIFQDFGFEINRQFLNPQSFEYQKDITQWGLRKGRAGVFADCGLGKTLVQSDWGQKVYEHTNKNILIVAPLCVTDQTIMEGKKFGIEINHLRDNPIKKGLNIINYENLDKINPDDYIGVVLDESSILKNYTGKTKKKLLKLFHKIPYRLCCTATPSPNDYMELLNHAEFLGVMKSNEALMRWFINDSMNTGKYRLKKHAERDFWEWVSSWAVFISKPSDLGYSDEGFELPKLNEIIIDVDCDLQSKDSLFSAYDSINATNLYRVQRDVMTYKIDYLLNLLRDKIKDDQFSIWCINNDESDLCQKFIKNAINIKGSDSYEKKIKCSMDFINGNLQGLISKAKIYGYGMNFQNCHNVIIFSQDFSYEKYYQLIKRFHRYNQKHDVNIYRLLTWQERDILDKVTIKKELHETMKKKMKKYQSLFNVNKRKEIKMDYKKEEYKTDNSHVILGDCVQEIKSIEDESVDFQIFSPPFSQLYIYSDNVADMGNNSNDEDFFKHFEFLIPELYRILKSGRICAVHCKQLVNYINRDGASGLRDFRGDIIRSFQKNGFIFHSEVVIWKSPVIEMQRTKSHGLLYKQLRADSTYSRQGLPDYLVIFRKWTNKGDVSPVNYKTEDNFKLDKWQEYASPVWMDIQQTNCLNVKMARDNEDEKHICPLQLEVIERAIELWTNPGDTIFTPFAGIGSELYQSILMGRKAIGIELKETYYKQSITFCLQAEEKIKESQRTLFDEIAL